MLRGTGASSPRRPWIAYAVQGWRRELGLSSISFVVLLVAWAIAPWGPYLVLSCAAFVLLQRPDLRENYKRGAQGRHLIRRLQAALWLCAVVGRDGRIPSVERVETLAVGRRYVLRMPVGLHFEAMAQRAAELAAALDAFITQVVEREGPVDRSIIHRRVADELGRNKTKKIVRLVDERLDRMISLDQLKYWKPSALSVPGQDVNRVRHPDPDDPVTKRDSRTYPLTELIGAVFNIVNEVGSIEVDELYDVVVKILFGYQRTTLQWKDRIDEVLEMGNGEWFELDDAVVRRLKEGRTTS